MRNRFNSLEHVQTIDCPVFQSHGTDDQIVPIELARQLHENVQGPKEFYVIEDGTHYWPEPANYFKSLRRFLAANSVTKPTGR